MFGYKIRIGGFWREICETGWEKIIKFRNTKTGLMKRRYGLYPLIRQRSLESKDFDPLSGVQGALEHFALLCNTETKDFLSN